MALTLTDDEERDLVDQLAKVLEEMYHDTCRDMVPLWLLDSRRTRKRLREVPIGDDLLSSPLSPKYLRLGKSGHSKYRALASWRHAVIWKKGEIGDHIADPKDLDAMEVVWFTACPNEPPYAWSQRPTAAPGVERFDSPREMSERSKKGAYRAVKAIWKQHRELVGRLSTREDLEGELLGLACRQTLSDVLKLEDHPNWQRETT